jgi:hypothetical protein
MRADELAHYRADVRVQVVPHQHDRGVQLVVRGGDQGRVVGLQKAAALAPASPVQTDAIEQAIPRRGTQADQPGHRHPPGALPGHRHHRRMAARRPGARFGRAQGLPGLILEANPRPGRRRYPRTFAQEALDIFRHIGAADATEVAAELGDLTAYPR